MKTDLSMTFRLIGFIVFPVLLMGTSSEIEAQNLPVGINKIDSKNRRQGDWVIWFDEDFKPINNQKAVHYYRVITYKDDKPTGPFTDFYRNGSVQSSGKLLNDRPEDVYDGLITWFRKNGTKEQETLYKRGEIIGDSKLYSSNGTMITESFERLNARGQEARFNGDLGKAKDYFEDALLVTSAEYGTDHIYYATILNNVAMVEQELNEFETAEENYLAAIAIYEKELGKQSELYATALNNLGLLYQAMGALIKAEVYLVESMNIRENVFGSSHPDYALAVNNLGNLYMDLGLYNKAIDYFKKAVALKDISFGRESSEYATSITNLGLAYISIGEYELAESLLYEALNIKKKIGGKNNIEYAGCLNNMGYLYVNTGNLEKAERLYLEAKGIYNQGNRIDQGYTSILNNLAILYRQKREYAKAEFTYQECIRIKGELVGKEHPSYINSLNNLAELYREMLDFDKAEQLYLHVKQNWERTLGENHPLYATVLTNLGALYMDKHDFYKAEPLLLRAKSIRENILGRDHPDYNASLNSLAVLYDNNNEDLKAEPFYRESIGKKMIEILNFFPSLSEEEKARYYRANQIYIQNFEEFCLKRIHENPSLAGDLYNLRLLTKALLFNAVKKMRLTIQSGGDATLIELFSVWQSKRDLLAKTYRMTLEGKSTNGINQLQLEEEINAIEKELSKRSKLFVRENDHTRYTWKDVRDRLEPGEAAVEIIKTQRRTKEVLPVYVALVVKSGLKDQPEVVVLENGNELETKYMRYYRNAVSQKVTDAYSYDQFWKPIAGKLVGVKRIYLSTDGVFNQINFNTLFDNGTNQFLLDVIDVRNITSTKELITASRDAMNEIHNATLFGYPDYNSTGSPGKNNDPAIDAGISVAPLIKNDSSQRFFNGESITELPGTKREVESIASILDQNKVKVNVHVFSDASEDVLKKVTLSGVLHIATHGYFLQDGKSTSGERGYAGFSSEVVTENPLLRSGLLLSGAKNAFLNTSNVTSDNDGLLTAYEAMNLGLEKTYLVVLSACETGLGVTVNGEGVYGLQRAFAVAGSRYTLMSLWKVDDVATQEFMTSFYRAWVGHWDIIQAYRMAQTEVRSKYREPYYWGAFVLSGL